MFYYFFFCLDGEVNAVDAFAAASNGNLKCLDFVIFALREKSKNVEDLETSLKGIINTTAENGKINCLKYLIEQDIGKQNNRSLKQ